MSKKEPQQIGVVSDIALIKAKRPDGEPKEVTGIKQADLISAGIGPEFLKYRWEDFDTDVHPNAKEYVEKLKALAKGETHVFGYSMIGECDRGKSMLACLTVHQALSTFTTWSDEKLRKHSFRRSYTEWDDEFNPVALRIPARHLVQRIKHTWNTKENEVDLIKFFGKKIELLVLEEIGVQFASETERIFLSEVIDLRLEWQLPTILTSNLKMDEIEKRIGKRSRSRFKRGGGEVLTFDDTWKPYRKKK